MKNKTQTRLGVPVRSAADWEEAALDLIAGRGIAALSIPELARSLEVTKGSFYWHFSKLDDLIVQAVERWERLDKATLDEMRQIKDPVVRLRALFAEAMSAQRAQSLYIALSVSPSPAISKVFQRVSARRMKLLAGSYREIGMTDDAAQQQSLLAYCAYIGSVHLRSTDAPWFRRPAGVNAYVEHAARVLIQTKGSEKSSARAR
jgi:AcrR family transcriptional regulator